MCGEKSDDNNAEVCSAQDECLWDDSLQCEGILWKKSEKAGNELSSDEMVAMTEAADLHTKVYFEVICLTRWIGSCRYI